MSWNYSDYSANSDSVELALLLSERSQQLLLAAVDAMDNRYAWVDDNGEPVSDSDWDTISAAIAECITEIMTEL